MAGVKGGWFTSNSAEVTIRNSVALLKNGTTPIFKRTDCDQERTAEVENRVALCAQPSTPRSREVLSSPSLARASWARDPCACPAATLVTTYVHRLARTRCWMFLQKVSVALRLQAFVSVTCPLVNFS